MRDLTLACGEPDDQLAPFIEAHRGGSEIAAEAIRNQLRTPVAPYGNGTVGRAEIDSDDHASKAAGRAVTAWTNVKAKEFPIE
jgi:hypothetical protein